METKADLAAEIERLMEQEEARSQVAREDVDTLRADNARLREALRLAVAAAVGMTHANGYPAEATPKAVMLSLFRPWLTNANEPSKGCSSVCAINDGVHDGPCQS